MEFGLGKNKQVQDLYPENAIINLIAHTEESTISKITFNKKAYEILGLTLEEENEIAFSTSKSEIGKTYLINANNYDSKANIKLRKTGTFSNKNTFSVLKKRYNTKMEDELLLEIIPSDKSFAGQTIFELVKFKEEKATDQVEALVDQQEEI